MNAAIEIQITSLDIQNEMDIMLAHRRAMQFAKFSGISLSEQTRFATAVSEIARNCVEYADKGVVDFSISKKTKNCFLLATIRDEGKGIGNLAEILERRSGKYKGRGLGIVFAKKLADEFSITSSSKGTVVYIRKNIAGNIALINNLTVQGWVRHLQEEPAISAYEELKVRNMQLVELTEELRANAGTVEEQLTQIKNLNARLSANNDRMKAFTYAVSHDLKTPLTNLKLSSAYLIDNAQGEETGIFQGILGRAVSRLDRTIHSLIEILDIQNDENYVIRPLDLAVSFAEAVEEFDPTIRDTGASVVSDFTGARTINYVEGFLQSLLRNLISNALKYRDPKRPLHIQVATKETPGGILLLFSDTGLGMDLNTIKDRLFKPFSRFSSSSAEGKGIGLYLIKSMVENNGGSVRVESVPGRGTTFYFTLVPYNR